MSDHALVSTVEQIAGASESTSDFVFETTTASGSDISNSTLPDSAMPESAMPDSTMSDSTGSINNDAGSSAPSLGDSILNSIITTPAIPVSETHLDILNHAATSLEVEGQITIKQEPSDEPRFMIDLTEETSIPVVISDDEDDDILPQTQADQLPQTRKRTYQPATEEDGDADGEDAAIHPSPKKKRGRGGKMTPARKTPARKPTGKKTQKAQRDRTVPTVGPTVRGITGSTLFRDIAAADEAEDLPEWYDSTKTRVASLAALATSLSKNASRDEKRTIEDDKRKLNRACAQFGSGNIRPSEDSTWRVKGMKSTLRPHQVIGTAWMMQREKNDETCHGGILADQMGLGKTVMSLALIVLTRNDGRGDSDRAKTTLIVGNAALRHQWYTEIDKHCISGRTGIRTFKQYASSGEQEKKNPAIKELMGTDVVITTFEEVMKSYPIQEPPPELVDADERQIWWEQHFEEHKGVLHSIPFKRIIIDEAHLIRNPSTHRSRACRALTGKYRWALTGTPFVNGVFDIFTLFDFIKFPLPQGLESMQHRFKVRADSEMEHELNGYMSKCMLRRDRSDKLFNHTLVALPSANYKCIPAVFNPVEREIYKMVMKRLKQRAIRKSESGTTLVIRNSNILAMITRCRQMTSHPLVAQSSLCDLLERSDLTRLNKVLKQYNKSGSPGLEMIKVLRKALDNHKEQSDKLSQVNVVLTQQQSSNGDDDDGPEPTTGKRHGKDYNFGKCFDSYIEFNDLLDSGKFKECVFCNKVATEPQLTSCEHIYCQECLDQAQEEAAQQGESSVACAEPECGLIFDSTEPLNEIVARAMAFRKATTKTVKGVTRKAELPATVIDFLEKGGPVPYSAKTIAVKAQILEWKKHCPREKIIIYTQWIPMVKILSLVCKNEGWQCCKYTSQMSHLARQKVLEEFARDDNLTIMLVGLRCGSLGLNLTMANRVISLDPWWNNAVEDQAFGRVHRIGQTRDTEFLQVIVKDSIDEKMQSMKADKQSKIDAFSNVGELQKLNNKELLSLFGEVVEDEHGRLHLLDEDDDEDEGNDSDGEPEEVDDEDAA